MIDRKSRIYKNFCRRIRRRDRNKCQHPNCDQKCKRKEVHHILTVSQYPHLCYDEKNCILLCRAHHEETFGREADFVQLYKGIVDSKYHNNKQLFDFLKIKYEI